MTATIKTWMDLKEFCTTNTELAPREFIKTLFSDIDLDNECFHYYEIKIKGDNFHSSITTGYAASLIDLQDNFYKLLLTLSKGNIPVRKSKNLPQMSFTVTEGCSILKSQDLIDSFTNLISELKMLHPVSLSIIAITVIGCFICNGYLDYKKIDVETLKEVQMAQIELEKYKAEIQNHNEERKIFAEIVDSKKYIATLEYASEAGKQVRNSFIKNTPVNQVESLTLPTETLTKNQLIDEQQEKSIEKTSSIEELKFKILNLGGSIQKGKMKAKVCLADDPEVTLTLNSDLFDEYSDDIEDEEHTLSESDIDVLWNAQKHSGIVSIFGTFYYDQNNKLLRGTMWKVTAVK